MGAAGLVHVFAGICDGTGFAYNKRMTFSMKRL